MQLKHLIQQFSYRIESKPECGFIARATDPTVPPLEAPTREQLQEKIQENLIVALSEAFPSLKLPVQNRQLRFEVHIERKPGAAQPTPEDIRERILEHANVVFTGSGD